MKLLLLAILSALFLSASSIKHQVKILEKVVSEISLDEKIIIWSDDKDILAQLKNNNRFKTTPQCQNASIIVLKEKKELSSICSKAHVFVLNYELLSDIPQSFGALFWKKGRPNIVILEPRIKTQNIRVSLNLEPYLEEKIW